MNTNETTTTKFRIILQGKPENLAEVKKNIWGDEKPATLAPGMVFPMDDGNKHAPEAVREAWIKMVWGGVTDYAAFKILIDRDTEFAFSFTAEAAGLGFILWELETICINKKVSCGIYFAGKKRGYNAGMISTDCGSHLWEDGGEKAIKAYESLWELE